MALTSLADFERPMGTDGSRRVRDAVRTSLNHSDPRKRMPPTSTEPLTAQELALMNAWLDAGVPGTNATCAPAASTTASTSGVVGGTSPVSTSGASPSPANPPDVTCYRMLAHAQGDLNRPYNVGMASDSYIVMTFAPPWRGTAYGVSIRPVISNAQVIHHWLLFQDDGYGTPGSIGSTTGAHPAGQLVYGWAPGGDGIELREWGDVGIELPGNVTYTMEYHYNSRDPSAMDASGVELCVKNTPTTNVAGLSWLGTDNLFPSSTWRGTCAHRSSTPINVIALIPHMHQKGVHMNAVIQRASGGNEVLHDAPFNFEFQRLYKKNNVVLMPGDRVTTTCTFNGLAMFGTATSAEMCYLFTLAYPKGALSDGGSWGRTIHGGSACLGQ